LTMLYRSTDRRCRCGAPMKNLAHSASLESLDKNAPSKTGTKQMACMPLAQGAERQAPQITGWLFQVLAFKCLPVYQLTILPFNYLYSAVMAAL
jgi:hypothetical protein